MIPADQARAQRLAQGWLWAVDPGLENPAVAVFERGTLVHASRVRVPNALIDLDRGERCRQITLLIVHHVEECGYLARPDAVVAECPQIYTANKSKGDPNKLVPLVMISAQVPAILGCEAILPLPAEWIGSIKKVEANGPAAWNSPRGKLIRRRLRDHEYERVVPSHDSLDACGIGLWVLGRLERVYVGAT